jgi:ribosome-associated toxin RatA of RatAB toxin-antitoxin module
VVAVVAAGIASSAALTARAGADDPAPRVVEKDGLYQITATFAVPHAAGLVRAVLTDYEHIPEFLSDVRVSQVLEQSAGRTVVRQEAVARLLFLSRRLHLELEILETPGRIRFRDVGGRSFLRYEGEWRISEDAHGTSVTYELTAQPIAAVPGVLVRRVFRQDVQTTIAQLKREMTRRAAQAQPAKAA